MEELKLRHGGLKPHLDVPQFRRIEQAARSGSLPEETPPETEASADTPTAPADTPTDRSAEAAFKIIAEMRGNRVSFEKIADHLEAEGVSMVSGNGKWNRRIVSKVYKDSVL